MRLFLVRHGESWANAFRSQVAEPAQLNAVLTEAGEAQAQSLARWMPQNVPHLDALYASTLKRTRQTASYLESAYGIQAILDDRIREGGYNDVGGAPIPDDQLPNHKTTDYHRLPFTPLKPDRPDCESFTGMRRRVGLFLEDMITKHTGQTVCAVIHGWTLNAFVDVILDVGQYRRCYVQTTYTCLSYFEYRGEESRFGPWRVNFLSGTPHLPDVVVGLPIKSEEKLA